MRRSRSRQASGFTLVEIMAALAILGTAMFMLLQAQHGAMRLYQATRHQALVEELATRALGIAETEVFMGETNGSDEFGDRWSDCKYEYSAQEVSAEDQPGLVRIDLKITGPEIEYKTSVLIYMTNFSTS